MYKNRHKPAVCPKCGCELAQKSTKEKNVRAEMEFFWGVKHWKPVFLWSFNFLFLSLCLCWIRVSPSLLLKRISSGRVRCSCYNGPCRSLRVTLSFRKLWPSSRNSTASRLSWFSQVISSESSLQRTRRWLSLGGLASMNVQLHTAACATVLSSKETKGEEMDCEMISSWLGL